MGFPFGRNRTRTYDLISVSHLNGLSTTSISYLWQFNVYTAHKLEGKKSKSSTESAVTIGVANGCKWAEEGKAAYSPVHRGRSIDKGSLRDRDIYKPKFGINKIH